MTVFRLRRWLLPLSIVTLLVSAAVLAWSTVATCPAEVAEATARPAALTGRRSDDTRMKLSLKDFEPLLAGRLQAPLFDPPPPAPAPEVKKELPPPPVKLLATMPEPGGGYAMFSDAVGNTLVKSLGGEILSGGVKLELVEVAGDHVVVRQQERLITLKLPH